MLSINSNIVSLNAQRNLAGSGALLANSLQRLSSGLRVNSARDDAAGLAIASRMQAQVRGINQGIRNANDGLSMVQTAEGAMGQVQEALQKMRELAVQGANGTLGAGEQAYIAGEMRQLRDQVDNVARSTAFNGTKLLDGSTGAASTTSTVAAPSSTLAVGDSFSHGMGSEPGRHGDRRHQCRRRQDLHAVEFRSRITLSDGVTSQTLTPTGDPNEVLNYSDFGVRISIQNTLTPGDHVHFFGPTLDGETIVTAAQTTTSTATTELQIGGDASANSRLSLSMIDARMSGSSVGNDLTALNTALDAYLAAPSAGGAHDLIADIDDAIDYVSAGRSRLGAQLNRIDHAIAGYQVQAENMEAARGRIVDADFAVETATLSRAQILQQAGVAMLAQANALPQSVLSLLR